MSTDEQLQPTNDQPKPEPPRTVEYEKRSDTTKKEEKNHY